MALENHERQLGVDAATVGTPHELGLIEKALAEQLRLRGWLRIISNCNPESTAEDRYARRIRYIARRALAGDGL